MRNRLLPELWRLISHQICRQQAGEPKELLVHFQSKSESLSIRRAKSLSYSLKAGRLETQEEMMFQFMSKGWIKLIFQIEGS